MSKSCKIDTNSYSETGSLCSPDARKELNLAPRLPQSAPNYIPIHWERLMYWNPRLKNNPAAFAFEWKAPWGGILMPLQKWHAAFGYLRWRSSRGRRRGVKRNRRQAGWQTRVHQDTTLEQVAHFSQTPRTKWQHRTPDCHSRQRPSALFTQSLRRSTWIWF